MGKITKFVAIAAAIGVNFIPGVGQAISGAIVSGLGGTFSALAVAQIAVPVITAGLTAWGLASAASLVAPSLPTVKGQGAGIAVNYRQPIINAPIVYGRAYVGGPITFYHATQGEDEYRYFVVTLASHEVHQIEGVYLNDELVSLSGNVVTNGDYANNCWIWPQTGTESDTPPSAFTTETGGRWTSAHRGKGVAKLYVKFKLTDEIISGGLPKMCAVVKGKRVYDYRTETTAYSNNAALCFWDYMLTSRSDGGYGLEDIEVDEAHIAAEANICDEDVETIAGTEKRYCIDGVVDTGAGPDLIREELLLAMAGDYAEIGPKVYAYAGAWRPTVAQLSESDVVSNISYRSFGTNGKYVNEVRGVFISEDDLWQPMEFPAQRVMEDEEPQTADLEFKFTKSGAAAQRIARIFLNRTRAEKSLTWPMNINGLQRKPFENVTISQTLYPHLSNYAFSIRGWTLTDQCDVTLQLVEESPDFYDWDVSMEQEISRPSISLVKINPGQIGAGGGVTSFTADAGGSAGEIDIAFTMPATAGVISWALYRAHESTLFADAVFVTSGAATTLQAITYTDTGLTTGDSYSYWVIVYTYFGSFTTPVGPQTEEAP